MATQPDKTRQEDSPSGGWTNEFVRAGVEVDGSESRIIPVPMAWRERLVEAEYEVYSDDLWESLGEWRRDRLHPIIRRGGAVLGWERAAEQVIAEFEYLHHSASAVARTGVGSRRWWLGIGYICWKILLTFAIVFPTMVGLGLAVGDWIPYVLGTYLGIGPEWADRIGALLSFGYAVAGLVLGGWLLYQGARAYEPLYAEQLSGYDSDFWDPFETVGVPAFVFAGLFLPGTILLNQLQVCLRVGSICGVRSSLFYSGLILLAVGMVGLYPRVVEQAPGLTLAGVVCVGFGLVSLLVFPPALVGVAIPLGTPIASLSSVGVTGLTIAVVLPIFLFPLGALLFGVASLKSDVLPGSIDYLLLSLGGVFVAVIGLAAATDLPDWSFKAVFLIVAGISLAIGYLLWRQPSEVG